MFQKSFDLKISVPVIILGVAACLQTHQVVAHGTITSPPSRVYNCFQEGPENPQSAACQAARGQGSGSQQFYDWNGVRQGEANDNHRAVVADGQLCSGGDPGYFGGLDLARGDWVSTNVSSGSRTFTWTNTAPHNTQYYDYYVTRNGYNPSQPLRWSDLEFVQRFGPSAAAGSASHTINLPSRSGRHVVYSVWQRTLTQSPEAFYACVDVIFGGGGGSSSSGGSSSGGSSSGGSSSGGSSSGGSSGGGSCSSQQYVAGNSYSQGELVQNVGNEYRCNVAGWCSIGGAYEPGVGWAWSSAWSLVGGCGGGSSSGGSSSGGSSSGGSSSGGSSSGGSSSGGSSSGGGSCGPAYVDGANYSVGDKVSNGGRSYECKVAGWCSVGGPYAPGTGWASQYAWTDLGVCP